MAISDMAVRNAKPKPKPKDKPYKPEDRRGPYLLVGINGSRLWRFDYMFQGKRKLKSPNSFGREAVLPPATHSSCLKAL